MGVPLSRPVFLVVGVVYPGYATFKALEGAAFAGSGSGSGGEGERETSRRVSRTQWLSYWVVYAFMTSVERSPFGKILSLFPMSSWLKLAALIWMVHPKWRGASQAYARFVRPQLRSHEKEIDKAIRRGSDIITQKLSEVAENGKEIANEIKKGALQRLSDELVHFTADRASRKNTSEASAPPVVEAASQLHAA